MNIQRFSIVTAPWVSRQQAKSMVSALRSVVERSPKQMRLAQEQQRELLHPTVNSGPSSGESPRLSSVFIQGQIAGEGDIQGPASTFPICRGHLCDIAV